MHRLFCGSQIMIFMRSNAGELLALLGPLSPSAVAFDPHALARPVHASPRPVHGVPVAASSKAATPPTAKHSGRKSGGHGAAHQTRGAPPWLAPALRQLYAALLDADVAIIKISQVTLRPAPITATRNQCSGCLAEIRHLSSFRHLPCTLRTPYVHFGGSRPRCTLIEVGSLSKLFA